MHESTKNTMQVRNSEKTAVSAPRPGTLQSLMDELPVVMEKTSTTQELCLKEALTRSPTNEWFQRVLIDPSQETQTAP